MSKQKKDRQPPPGRETIDRLASGIFPSLAMLAGMELGVFSKLGKGACNGKEVAARMGVAPRRLQPLLYALVAGGLLTLDNGRFANTLEADHYLVEGHPDFLRGLHTRYRGWWQAAFQTAASIRENRPMADHDFSAMDNAEIRGLFAMRDAGSRAAGRDLARRFDFSRFGHLADGGGGGGSMALGAMDECPGLQASLVELPNIASVAGEFLQEIGEAERLNVVATDVTRASFPGRYDLAVMKALIQVLSPEQAREAIANTGRVMEPGGLLIITGRVVDDSRISPPEIVGFGLVFLNNYHEGTTYTEGEHREWLQAAGFSEIERHVDPDKTSIILARKV